MTLRDFAFRSGEKLAALRVGYTTLGTPHRNAKGEIDNAVMVLHGTGGLGKSFLVPPFADELYAPGAPLDGAASGLVALGIREDPLVAPTSFPMGHYVLLQLVGVTAGEHGVMGKVGTALVLAKLAERDALLRTDPSRA